jgi:hypothetical protein
MQNLTVPIFQAQTVIPWTTERFIEDLNVTMLVRNGLNLLLFVIVVASVLYLVLAGLKFITSGGDPKKSEEARSAVINVIIGLIVSFMAYFIVQLVLSQMGINIGIFDTSQNNNQPSPTVTNVPEINLKQYKIGYLEGNNVFVVNADGTEKKQLTSFGANSNIEITSISWKNDSTLSYFQCGAGCQIFSVTIDTAEVKEEAKFPTATFGIVSWSPVKTELGFIAKEEYAFLTVDKNGIVTLGKYKNGQGEAVSHFNGLTGQLEETDQVDIKYSQDGAYFMVTNTITGNAANQKSVFVFDNSGDERVALNYPARYGVFKDKETILYRNNKELISRKISSNVEKTVVKDMEVIDPNVSSKGILFWTLNSSKNNSQIYYVNTNDEMKQIVSGLHNPEWMTQNHFIALKTPAGPKEQFLLPGTALVLFNISNSTQVELVQGQIKLFDVRD